MNILIENLETAEFLNADGGWTKIISEAKNFPSAQAAFRSGRQQAIGSFTVVGNLPPGEQLFNFQRGRGTGRLEAGETLAAVPPAGEPSH